MSEPIEYIEHPPVVESWLNELGLTINDLDRGSANIYRAWIRTDTAGDMTFDLSTKRGDKATFRGVDGNWTRVQEQVYQDANTKAGEE